MPDNDANHSRSPGPQPPIGWDDVAGEMLLSMPDNASEPTPTIEAGLDLNVFKRSLGTAPPAKFNSEGGLSKPWAGGTDSNPDRGSGTTPRHDSSRRERARIETDSEAPFRRRRVKAFSAALALLAYSVAAFCWSLTDWQRQIESPLPSQNQRSLDDQALSAATVLSPGVLLGFHHLTVEELALLKVLIVIFPLCSFGGAVAALLVRGRRDPRWYRRLWGRSFAGVTSPPGKRSRSRKECPQDPRAAESRRPTAGRTTS
jgi:hypothetical protein